MKVLLFFYIYFIFYLKKNNLKTKLKKSINTIVGSPFYMSPELISGGLDNKKIIWAKSDIYSLGITLLETCTLIKIIDLKNFDEAKREDLIEKKVKSPLLKLILPKMLKKSIDQRSSFEEILKVVKKFGSNDFFLYFRIRN